MKAMSLHSSLVKKTLAAGAVVAVAAIGLAGCSSSGSDSASEDCTPAHEFETVTPGTLTVATYDYPPATIIEGDKLSGIEGEILDEIAKMECLTLTVDVTGGAGGAIPAVESGRADIAAGSWNRTKARAEIVNLGTGIWTDQYSLASKTPITDPSSLDGKKIGSVVGNFWEADMKAKYGDNYVVYPDAAGVYGDLAAGRIDMVVDGYSAQAQQLEANPIEGVELYDVPVVAGIQAFETPGQINFPYALTNAAIGKAMDADIEKLRADGFIAKVLEKYGVNPELANITEQVTL